MKNILVVLLIIGICSCKKADEPQTNYYSFKTNWLIGEWSLKKGVQLSEYQGDTIFAVLDSTKSIYYPGGSKYESLFKVKLSFNANGTYQYNEKNSVESGSINSEWKWLNSSQNATHLYFPIAFNSYLGDAVNTPFKLLKLSETQLIIEDTRGFFQFEYERVTPINNEGGFEPIKLISPQLIVGNWQLAKYHETFSDGRAQWTENDTLFYQYYDYYMVLHTSREEYSLTVSLGENGSSQTVESRSGQAHNYFDSWYWSDETEPHKSIYMYPVLNSCIVGFTVKTISQDSLVLEYDKVSYKFKRKN
jgi:hypothetical protein